MTNPTITLAFSATLDDATYNANRYRIILPLEEKGGTPSLSVYVDSVGIATIGAGFNIKAQAVSILTTILGRPPVQAETTAITSAVAGTFAVGAAGNAAAQNALNTALRAATGNNALSFTFANAAEGESTFGLIADAFEKRVNAWLPGIPNSRERLAFLSMAYNNVVGAGQSPTLRSAVINGDRAEAWFQIRYDSNGGASRGIGIAKRRILESELFSLHKNPTSVTESEARDVFAMVQRHHDFILTEELIWASTFSNGKTALQLAQTDYISLLPHILDGSINDLQENLTPARDKIVALLNTEFSLALNAADFKPFSIYTTAASNTTLTDLLDARRDDSSELLSKNILIGNEKGNTIEAGAGADVIWGGAGADTLKGGTGTDTYVFKSGDGKDSITDSDGLGTIKFAGISLTGAGAANYMMVGGQGQWSVNSGQTIYTLDEAHQRLVISGTLLGAGNDITINNVDVTKLTGSEGYMGITLTRTSSNSLKTADQSTPYATPGAGAQSASKAIGELTGAALKWFTNIPALFGDTFTGAVKSGDASKAKLVTGAETLDLSSPVTINLAEGQTERAFAIVNDSAITSDQTLELVATYHRGGEALDSNTFTLNITDTGATTSTRNGDQRAKLIGIEIDTNILPGDPLYNTYKWSATSWATDGSLTGGVADPNFSDVIVGTAGNDKISGAGGNDALSGGVGNDDIDGGAGDDLIGGGAGSDKITGGDGNDYINTSATLNVQQRLSPTDSWSPPGGQVVKTQGAGWGIYIDTQGGSPITIWSGSANPAGTDGDNVDGGAASIATAMVIGSSIFQSRYEPEGQSGL